MEAGNRGAADVEGGRSVGLGISLPFEEDVNAYVTDEARPLSSTISSPESSGSCIWQRYSGWCSLEVGTLDELMELLTLVQTKKISKPLPIVLFGKAYWNSVINFEAMVEWGTISAKDLDLFLFTDDVDEAVEYMTSRLVEAEKK